VIRWAAGLFEGEGCATRCGGRIRLSLKMTDEESVRRFERILAAGKIYGPYSWEGADGCVRRPFWMRVAEGESAWIVADKLWPWLSTRRCEQISAVFGETD
jgi:hypothetical protein